MEAIASRLEAIDISNKKLLVHIWKNCIDVHLREVRSSTYANNLHFVLIQGCRCKKLLWKTSLYLVNKLTALWIALIDLILSTEASSGEKPSGEAKAPCQNAPISCAIPLVRGPSRDGTCQHNRPAIGEEDHVILCDSMASNLLAMASNLEAMASKFAIMWFSGHGVSVPSRA